MNESWGLAHFWAQGDTVSHVVAITLLLLSATSWTCIAGKALGHWRLRRSMQAALSAYWQAGSRPAALAAIVRHDGSGLFAGMVQDVERAAQAYALKHPGEPGGALQLDEFLGRTLQHTIVQAQTRLEHGLTVLATAGSVAPFVGLLGTVWGIYHALTSLTGASQLALDRVAGPVGEALIMTAVGLFVAIPAVLAYNACTRGNRLVLARLDAFAHSLHAYLVAGVRPLGETGPVAGIVPTCRVAEGG